MEETFITRSFLETQKIGEEFAANNFLVPGDSLKNSANIIALYGDLGSGKTTFVQGLAKRLGVARRIISPTFIIVRKYESGIIRQLADQESRIKSFYHIDLYRAETEHDIDGLGLKELMEDPENILAIEWPEKLENVLPQKRWDIHFEHLTEYQRRICIKQCSP